MSSWPAGSHVVHRGSLLAVRVMSVQLIFPFPTGWAAGPGGGSFRLAFTCPFRHEGGCDDNL